MFLNILACLFGKKSLVGYDVSAATGNQLPEIKKGILYPTMDVPCPGEGLNNKINPDLCTGLFSAKDLKIFAEKLARLDS